MQKIRIEPFHEVYDTGFGAPERRGRRGMVLGVQYANPHTVDGGMARVQWDDGYTSKISTDLLDSSGPMTPGEIQEHQDAITPNDRARALQATEKLINGDRAQIYGGPEESFGRIADLWSAMGLVVATDRAESDHRALTAHDVALALVQLKVSRIISSPDHEDSHLDLLGYGALAFELRPKGEPMGMVSP